MTSGWVPLLVDLAGRRVVCVGGGPVAAGKLAGPREAGAEIVVVAPELDDALASAAARGALTWHARAYAPGDTDGAALVIAATASPEVNDAVAAEAAERGTPCVRTDRDPDAAHPGTAAFPATVRRGPLTIAVGTSGTAPALARWLRDELDALYPEEYGVLAQLLAEVRADPRVQACLRGVADAERRARWRTVLEADTLRLVREGYFEAAKEVAITCLCSSSG